MKTAELSGALLDSWVARAQGHQVCIRRDLPYQPYIADPANHPTFRAIGMVDPGKTPAWDTWVRIPEYSREWNAGGPIIDRERIATAQLGEGWCAFMPGSIGYNDEYWIDTTRGDADGLGETPLIAAMRAYVASKYGDSVPDDGGVV